MNKLDLITSSVAGITNIDSSYLLEDDEFKKQLVDLGNKIDSPDSVRLSKQYIEAVEHLVNYVNENY